LESKLESESFEPLIGFLAFLVQKLWPKNNKLINHLIREFIKYGIYRTEDVFKYTKLVSPLQVNCDGSLVYVTKLFTIVTQRYVQV